MILDRQVLEALAEVTRKSDREVEEATAHKWASRAIACWLLYRESGDLRWMIRASEMVHEAVEHGALADSRGKVLAAVRARIEEFLPREFEEHVSRTLAAHRTFQVGDLVTWNSEAGRVSGTIRKKITSPMEFKGYTVHASRQEPQYLIESGKTGHLAMHKGSALRKI